MSELNQIDNTGECTPSTLQFIVNNYDKLVAKLATHAIKNSNKELLDLLLSYREENRWLLPELTFYLMRDGNRNCKVIQETVECASQQDITYGRHLQHQEFNITTGKFITRDTICKHAVQMNYKSVISKTLNNGLDVNTKLLCGNTLFTYAVFPYCNDEIPMLLLAYGADPTIVNNSELSVDKQIGISNNLKSVIEYRIKQIIDKNNARKDFTKKVLDMKMQIKYMKE